MSYNQSYNQRGDAKIDSRNQQKFDPNIYYLEILEILEILL